MTSVKIKLIFATLFVCALLINPHIHAQEYGQAIPPSVLQNMSPEEQKMMQQMMQKLQNSELNSEEDMMKFMMDQAEQMPSRCKTVEEEIRQARVRLKEDLEVRDDFDHWYRSFSVSTESSLDKKAYKKNWQKCLSTTSSSYRDIMCHHLMFSFFMPDDINNLEDQYGVAIENFEGRIKSMTKKYDKECSAKNAQVDKELGIDKPRKGDALLITEHGSSFIGERNGLILGNFLPDLSKKGKPSFEKVK